jgi:hypothetical protein
MDVVTYIIPIIFSPGPRESGVIQPNKVTVSKSYLSTPIGNGGRFAFQAIVYNYFAVSLPPFPEAF